MLDLILQIRFRPVLLGAVWAALAMPVLAGDYHRIIVPVEKPGKILAPAVADLARVLEEMTGKPFSVTPGGAGDKGIVLASAAWSGLPAAVGGKLAAAAGQKEPFQLWSRNPELLVIAANDERGLAHGIYTFLHRLGCRWVLPGKNWEIIPRRQDIALELDEFIAPDFRSRDFFGTGAFGIRTPVDPKLQVTADYDAWRRRNRWGGEFTVGGHAWEGFVQKNEELLKARPEFLAEVNGVRGPLYRPDGKLREQVKFCVSNPELTKLFAEDRIKVFRDRPQFPATSIEVSDGGSHCECARCLAIGNGSVSDRVFDFANRVAAMVAAEFPDKVLTHYAYNEHAAVPSFKLHPNIYVQVIPNAFQTTRYSPTELLEAWGRHQNGRHLGTYDYWVLPDSNRDLPGFDFVRKPAETIRMWKHAGLDSFNIETSFGGGAVGLALYLTSQLAWDVNFDTAKALDEFYATSFGAAAGPMRRLLERWSGGFYTIPEVLGSSFLDMQAALAAAAGEPEAVRRRVLDFANYLQFARLYIEYRELPKGDAVRAERARAAVKLMWRNYFSYMIHVFRVQWMIRLNDEKGMPWIQEFDMRSPDEKGWQEVLAEGAVKPEETAAFIAAGVRDYGPRAMEIPRYAKKLVPLGPPLDGSAQLEPASFQTYGYTRFSILPPAGAGELRVRLRALAPSGNGKPPLRVRWFDNTELRGRSAVDAELDGEWREIVLPVNGAGLHELLVLSMARLPFEIILPKVHHAITQMTPYQPASKNFYFYVPAGVGKIIFLSSTVPGGNYRTTVLDEGHNEVDLEYRAAGNDHWFSAVNRDPARGKIWCLQKYRNLGHLKMITVPQAVSLSPDTLLVPAAGL